jgi:tetratricopeptide (TPR) repeat protein
MNNIKKACAIFGAAILTLITIFSVSVAQERAEEQTVRDFLSTLPASDVTSFTNFGRVQKAFFGDLFSDPLLSSLGLITEREEKAQGSMEFSYMATGIRFRKGACGKVENDILIVVRGPHRATELVESIREKFQKRDRQEKYGTRTIYLIGSADLAKALGESQIAMPTKEFAIAALDDSTAAFGTASYLKASIGVREGRGESIEPALVDLLARNDPIFSVSGKFSSAPANDFGLAGTKYSSIINASLSPATFYSASLFMGLTTFDLTSSVRATDAGQAVKLMEMLKALATQINCEIKDQTLRDLYNSLKITTRGNEVIIHADITKEKVETRLRELSGIKSGPEEKVRRESISATLLAVRGGELTSQQAKELEQKVKDNPQDLSSRTLLLGYYFLQSDLSSQEAKRRHVLWLIKNHPEAPIAGSPYAQIEPDSDTSAYEEARSIWLKQVEGYPKDTAVLAHAGQFFQFREVEIAESLFKQAAALEPDNHEWIEKLGNLYEREWRWGSGEASKKAARKAFQYYEQALRLTKSDMDRAYSLPDVAKFAYEANDLVKARDYATELLTKYGRVKDSHNYEDAIHYGNMVLGRIALKKGDTSGAKAYLLESGKTPGSPHLKTYGPSMILAKELLEKGERQAVIDYFHLCAKFWEGERGRLKEWEGIVKRGGMPDFDSTLYY